MTNFNGGNVSVLLGNGDGTFQSAVNFTVDTAPEGVAAGDFNGDGRMDLAVANYSSNNVSILLQPTPPPPPAGTITGVTAGAGLSGGGGSGVVTLSLNTAVTGARYLQITGNATTATMAGTATNALALGGVPPSGYAPASGSANYIQNNSGAAQSASLNISGSVTIGSSGTAIKEHISIVENPNFPALKGGTCASANFALAGASDGDTIALGVPSGRLTGGGILLYTAWFSAANQVTLQGCNVGGSPQKTAGTGSIRIGLWKE